MLISVDVVQVYCLVLITSTTILLTVNSLNRRMIMIDIGVRTGIAVVITPTSITVISGTTNRHFCCLGLIKISI